MVNPNYMLRTCPVSCNQCTSDIQFLVMPYNSNEAFIINGDGSSTKSNMILPSEDFTEKAPFAVIQGNVYIFGGHSDNFKIRRLDGCGITELSTRLNSPMSLQS